MRSKVVAAVMTVAVAVTGCADLGYGPKQSIGGLTGAALGGLLGAQFGSREGGLVATGAGVFIGALIGSEIGRSLDDADQARANDAVVRAHNAPLGERITWNNPESGNYGTITPVRDGTAASGAYCREFQQSITVSGRREQGYGVACRQPDGTWRIVQ
ncbi:MAG: RT0821/Lpp0805 family surface protein [Paracoccaceae bacterium]|nr:RT0821/Lpp0805 family surface protein [Paracoccaceae bacterium]